MTDTDTDRRDPVTLAADCDIYLGQRTATYEQRAQRYAASMTVIQAHGGLDNDDILLDLGAGGTDLDYFLRSEEWRGRYWPVDGWQGVDLNEYWAPQRQVSWVVSLELIEHLAFPSAIELLERAKGWVTKGIVVSTPNALTIDVIEMDDTHLWGATPSTFRDIGFSCFVTSLYGRPDDSLLAWWTP